MTLERKPLKLIKNYFFRRQKKVSEIPFLDVAPLRSILPKLFQSKVGQKEEEASKIFYSKKAIL